jgi:lipopolysaccharide export LptBFGC system permease protein LptF
LSSTPVDRDRPSEVLAGLLAATSIFMSLAALVYRPLRLVLVSILLGLIAAALGGRHARLAATAVFVGAGCFALGLTIAVLWGKPLW